MSSYFYKQISPTVQQFCKEDKIPYDVHNSLTEVFRESYETLKYYNSGKQYSVLKIYDGNSEDQDHTQHSFR